MSPAGGTSAIWQGPRLRLVIGLGRPQESRLLQFCRQDAGLRVTSRCSSAPEALDALRSQVADIALLDEDLHLLGDDEVHELSSSGLRAVILTRDPGGERWRNLRVYALESGAEPVRVLEALREAFRGEARARTAGAETPPPPEVVGPR